MPKSIQVIKWTQPNLLSEQEAEARLHQEGFENFKWQDVPGVTYPHHHHATDECLWILKGEITITAEEQRFPLKPGDRIYLPAGIEHTTTVPKSGTVTYLVGKKKIEV